MSARSYLSIGDVLTLLRQEFPDVTISKIRFLESQGLVNPERTPSGYRKFYEHDVERLRWVLRQQREHFLPLKVIKDRLDDDAEVGTELPDAARPEAGHGRRRPTVGRRRRPPAPTDGTTGDGRATSTDRRSRCWSASAVRRCRGSGRDRRPRRRRGSHSPATARSLPGIESGHDEPGRRARRGAPAVADGAHAPSSRRRRRRRRIGRPTDG